MSNKPIPSVDASDALSRKITAASLSRERAVTDATKEQTDSREKDSTVIPVQDKLAAGAVYKDNILQTYDSSTYYLRLTMVNPGLAQKFDIRDGVVIAETGTTTDIVIKDCNMRHIVGWTPKSQGAFAHGGKITLVEPLGVKFLNKLVDAARALRIPNHTQATYFLELGFNGRDPDTGQEVIIPSGNSSTSNKNYFSANQAKPHMWTIKFTKVEMNVSQEGGVYNITFVNLMTTAQENTVENLKDSVNVPAKTVGEYFAGLEAALNKREENNIGITKFVANKYKFIVDPDFANDKFANFSPEQVTKARNATTKDGKNVPSFREGTGILGLINVIMSGTSKFQTALKLKTGASLNANEGMTTEKNKEKADVAADLNLFYRVHTWCECGPFDFFCMDFQKTMTYFIFPTLTPQLVTPSEQESHVSKDWGEYCTTQKLKAIKNSALLAKRYDYVYTGMNTSVIDFKIQLNSSFYNAAPPSDSGYTQDSSQPGAKMDANASPQLLKDKAAKKQAWDADRTSLKQLEKDGNGNSRDAQKIRERLRNSEQSKNLTQEQAIKTQMLGDINVFKNTRDTSANGRMNSSADTRSTTYGAPANLNYVDSAAVRDIADNALDPNFIVRRFLEDDVGTELSNGIEGPHAKNRGSFAYMFNQLRQGADLVNIKVDIVGDPYWLGRDNNALANFLKTAGQKSTLSKDTSKILTNEYADFETGSNYFYIKFQGPSDYDPDTGYIKFSTDDVISGVYIVKEVSSTFSDGRFVQQLDAFKDLSILAPFIDKTEAQFNKERTEQLLTDVEFAKKNEQEVTDLAKKDNKRAKEMLKKIGNKK